MTIKAFVLGAIIGIVFWNAFALTIYDVYDFQGKYKGQASAGYQVGRTVGYEEGLCKFLLHNTDSNCSQEAYKETCLYGISDYLDICNPSQKEEEKA